MFNDSGGRAITRYCFIVDNFFILITVILRYTCYHRRSLKFEYLKIKYSKIDDRVIFVYIFEIIIGL